MNRLARTKSQHFVSSPRKSATPKHRRLRHASKRRRIGSTLARTVSDPESSSSEESELEDGRTVKRGGIEQKRVKLQIVSEASPRKRKRSDEASNVHSAESGSDLDSGSWIEIDDDDEPEFIAESDQHLLQDAPAYALHRLRKAELIRLWRVAGMWAEDDEIEDDDGEKGKKELVDGLIAARKPPSPVSTPSPMSSPVSRSGDIDATPRAVPRTRAKNRIIGRKLFEENSRLRSTVKKPRPRTLTHKKRPSTSSSYTTTDASSPPTSPYQSPSSSRHKPMSHAFDEDATPLVHRLRSRTRSLLDASEDGDAEDEYEESEADSPGPSTRLRSRTSSLSHIEPRPSRGAKKRAINALAHMDDEVDMDEDREEPEEEAEPEEQPSSEPEDPRTTRSGRAFGQIQSRRRRLKQEARDDPELDDDEIDDDDDDTDDGMSFEPDIDLTEATLTSLTRYLRDELVQMCENRAIEVGGTKTQLAKALLEWRDEQLAILESQSEASTARPSSNEIIHAVASHVHVTGKNTPVLLRDHIHAEDPATPPRTDLSKRNSEAELNLDLAELGLEDSVIKPENLQKLEKIGSGGFKDVYVGKLHGRKVAISEFREPLSEMDIRELKLLAEFRHPNIVRFRGISIPEDAFPVSCMLVSELCENGDLFDYIRNVPCPPVKRVLGLMLDIARGLEYLHTRSPSIIHRDCKSSNILINSKGVAKVGDFGLARVKRSTRSMIKSLVGTVNWQAPELWHPAPLYDYKVDVFSAAMVYWEMMHGWIGEKKYPWEGHNEHYIYDAVGQKRQRPSTAGLRDHWGDEPVNLMERMWHQDPGERPTMTDVVQDLTALKESL